MVTIGAAVIVHRFTLDWIAGVQGVTASSLRACANCDVTSGCACSVRTAFTAGARIPACKIDARPIVRTIAVGETLAALTAR